VLAPDFDALDRFLDGLLKGERLASFEVLSGGRANTNLRLVCRGSTPDLVLRLYQRDPAQREKEVAIADLLRGRVPVPDVVVHGADTPVLHGPYVLMKYVEGVAVEARFAALDNLERAALGRSLGATLAAIHAHYYEAPGFLDATLNVATPLGAGGRGLLAALDWLIEQGPAQQRLGERRCLALRRHLTQRTDRFDAWPALPRLVHGDFGFSNILIAGEGADVAVAAVLDWEFALAATPLLDLGNLIRPPGGEDGRFLGAIAVGYRGIDPTLPDDWIDLARAVDLLAWVDFAGREDAPDDLLDHTRSMIDGITESAAC
jgi:aminoglycoside phosphotransferase (APT) family kinase protein